MIKLTLEILTATTGHTKYAKRKRGFANLMNTYGGDTLAPHRMAQLLAQVCHESGGFRYTKEVWGPTAAQRRYEGRKDLGNVQKGDGKRFMGRDLIQITGRSNYAALTRWTQAAFGGFPNFEQDPDALLDHIGIGVLWYWGTRIPEHYIDTGDIEMITRRVNGGLNGYKDRLRYYDRAALAYLGIPTIREFQEKADILPDGISGPVTRSKLHEALVDLEAPKAAGGSLFSAILALITALFGRKDK